MLDQSLIREHTILEQDADIVPLTESWLKNNDATAVNKTSTSICSTDSFC